MTIRELLPLLCVSFMAGVVVVLIGTVIMIAISRKVRG